LDRGQGIPWEGNYSSWLEQKSDRLAKEEKRIITALQKRKLLFKNETRDHYYLLFGEADCVPGVFIRLLNNFILIQTYTSYPANFSDFLLKNIGKIIRKQDFFFSQFPILVEKRNEKKIIDRTFLDDKIFPDTHKCQVQENKMKFSLNTSETYDLGIYTDMASIREKLIPYFTEKENVLNLYSYTGAFTLLALNNRCQHVHSVDLSAKYMTWLEKNIEDNPSLNLDNHKSHVGSVEKKCQLLLDQKIKFDTILADPPSSSSDGKKRTSALQNYKNLIPTYFNLLKDGGHLIIFLNTHKVDRKKFVSHINNILRNHSIDAKIIKDLTLSNDCPVMAQFAEGDYLKGIILRKGSS